MGKPKARARPHFAWAHLASLLGVDESAVRQWAAQGMPTTSEIEAACWVARRWREQGKARAETSDARQRLLEAEADKAEHDAAIAAEKLAVMRREHVPVAEAQEAVSRAVGLLAQRLRGVSGSVAPRLDGLTMGERGRLIREKINHALKAVTSIRVVVDQADELEGEVADGQS